MNEENIMLPPYANELLLALLENENRVINLEGNAIDTKYLFFLKNKKALVISEDDIEFYGMPHKVSYFYEVILKDGSLYLDKRSYPTNSIDPVEVVAKEYNNHIWRETIDFPESAGKMIEACYSVKEELFILFSDDAFLYDP